MSRIVSVVLFSVAIAAGCTKENTAKGEPGAQEKVTANAEGGSAGKEHAGTAAGSEHAGTAAGSEHAGKEHAGKEHAGEGAASVSAAQIKAAINAHITEHAAGGIFKITDEKSKAELALKFVKIHDPVRKIEGKGYFACTDFSVDGDKEGKLYDLDFWLDSKDGKLVITNTKIHKHPKMDGGRWIKEARYTFVDDHPVEVK